MGVTLSAALGIETPVPLSVNQGKPKQVSDGEQEPVRSLAIHIEPRVNRVPESDFLIRIGLIAGPEWLLSVRSGRLDQFWPIVRCCRYQTFIRPEEG
jgi:hypothetical protein